MDRPNSMIFPNVGMHVLSAVIHLLGVTVLAHLISRRTILRGNFTLRDVTWPWICLLIIFIDSWLFIFTSGILVLGVGLEKNDVSCSMGIILCIIFYGSSKFFIYTFLLERVHVVWRPSPRSGRLQCKAYVWCAIGLLGYLGVVGVLFYGRVSYFGGDRDVCYIGLTSQASITLLTYDFFINALLTGLFLWPVMRSSFRNTRVRRLAVRTLWSALLALTTSCVNILILTLMHGRQLGWVCLGSCGTDVIVNALVIYWVTSQSSDQHDRAPTVPDVISPSKSGDPESGGTEPSNRGSKVVFKLGRSNKGSSAGVATMQIKVTTERIDNQVESSVHESHESEYELKQVHSIPQIDLSDVREETRSPVIDK